jgi:low affinity Fe/Cu permease
MIVNWWHRRQGADVRTVDERFTDFADRVSEAMGRWRTSAFCLVLIVIWGAFGPYTGYSDSWQLWVNTPTTIVELFLGLFTLAAANRVEKRNWLMHQQMARTLSRVDAVTAEENDEIKAEDQKLAAMQRQLDRIEKQLSTAESGRAALEVAP